MSGETGAPGLPGLDGSAGERGQPGQSVSISFLLPSRYGSEITVCFESFLPP